MQSKEDLMNEIEKVSFPFYHDVCEGLDPILKELELSAQTSIEGLNSNFFGRFLVKIADTMTGLLNTFKTNAFKFTKHLKRSEMREFLESNRAKTFVVNNLAFEKCKDVPMDVPANMLGTYVDAVNAVSAVYMKLNALPTAQVAYQALTEVFNGVTTEGGSISSGVTHAQTAVTDALKLVKPAVAACQIQFGSKLTLKRNFGMVYKSMADLKRCQTDLLNMEKRLQDVNAITEIIEKIEQLFKGMIPVVQNMEPNSATSITQKDVEGLANTAKSLALMFDAYGLAATRQMALEHNIIININNLYEIVR